MKKVLFVCKYPIDEKYNLKQKFNGQINSLINMGYDVYYFAYDKNNFYIVNGANKTKLKSISNANSSLYLHVFAFVDLYRFAKKTLSIDFDYMYIRNEPLELFGYIMYKETSKYPKLKVITEIPTYPAGLVSPPNKAVGVYLKFSSMVLKKASKYINLFTLIGKQSDGYHFSRPAINIENGVYIDDFSLRSPKLQKNEVNIIAIASMSKWQGYDRLIKGLANYKGNIPVKLHMVGNEGDGSLKEWKDLAESLNLVNVKFYGPLYGNELDDIINKCDVGVASLGMYRLNFNVASVLKIREYMARGIPFVYAIVDKALDDNLPFIFKVSNDNSDVDIEKVAEFALKFKNDINTPNNMRLYAKQNMSWEAQFKKIFDVVDNLEK
ncbi:MAG: glycosyltransferase [Christensenellaceae bacterium]|nr:glycosyltransferase [Christensenellaceae bacterium]